MFLLNSLLLEESIFYFVTSKCTCMHMQRPISGSKHRISTFLISSPHFPKPLHFFEILPHSIHQLSSFPDILPRWSHPTHFYCREAERNIFKNPISVFRSHENLMGWWQHNKLQTDAELRKIRRVVRVPVSPKEFSTAIFDPHELKLDIAPQTMFLFIFTHTLAAVRICFLKQSPPSEASSLSLLPFPFFSFLDVNFCFTWFKTDDVIHDPSLSGTFPNLTCISWGGYVWKSDRCSTPLFCSRVPVLNIVLLLFLCAGFS